MTDTLMVGIIGSLKRRGSDAPEEVIIATMQEVADRAGVSIATVSFVVNGTKRVSQATRDRVTVAMQELGFRNNVVARALASRRTRIIALLFPALEHRLGSTALRFFTSAASTAGQYGYNLVLWPVSTNADHLSELISGGLVDGVVLMEVQMNDARVERLFDMGVPFTSIGRTADFADLPFVDVDFHETLKVSFDHLVELGHVNIALVVEDLDGTSMEGYGANIRVEQAYLAEAERRGLRPTVVRTAESSFGGRAAASKVLEVRPDVTAIIIMKDNAAFGLVAGLESAGRAVPEDVSVLSIMTSPEMGASANPILTTMNAPSEELGQLSVEALIHQLEGVTDELPHALLPCVLNVADSTAPVRTRVVS